MKKTPKKKPAVPRLSKYAIEKELWQRIKGALAHKDRKAYRVETIATPGFPDVVWITEKGIVFFELKAGPLKIRAQQANFIKSASALGVTIWVVHQEVKRGDIMVYPGMEAVDLPGLDIDIVGRQPMEKWLEEFDNG